jgi:Na+-transporting methylmalonyl-CoA/oxaloacetate decarboxylase gamma subunit
MQFDLRNVNVLYYPLMDMQPGIRPLDTSRGVEITVTIAELDQMNVKPDFVIYATVEMKTTITETSGKITIIKSWDAAGSDAKVPEVTAGISDVGGDGNDGIGLVFIILPIIIAVILLIGGVILIFVLMSKKDKEAIQEPIVSPTLPEQSVEQMVFGEVPQETTPEQLYGTAHVHAQMLPQTPPESLPAAAIEQQQQVDGGQLQAQQAEVPPQTQAPAPPPAEQAAPAAAPEAPQVSLPEQQ